MSLHRLHYTATTAVAVYTELHVVASIMHIVNHSRNAYYLAPFVLHLQHYRLSNTGDDLSTGLTTTHHNVSQN